jgi:hypothetical protein
VSCYIGTYNRLMGVGLQLKPELSRETDCLNLVVDLELVNLSMRLGGFLIRCQKGNIGRVGTKLGPIAESCRYVWRTITWKSYAEMHVPIQSEDADLKEDISKELLMSPQRKEADDEG